MGAFCGISRQSMKVKAPTAHSLKVYVVASLTHRNQSIKANPNALLLLQKMSSSNKNPFFPQKKLFFVNSLHHIHNNFNKPLSIIILVENNECLLSRHFVDTTPLGRQSID
jgi:hypothetical protein